MFPELYLLYFRHQVKRRKQKNYALGPPSWISLKTGLRLLCDDEIESNFPNVLIL
jgi:hypothetical protein